MNPQQFNILVVDDENDIRSLIQDILEDEGYQVQTAKNATEADNIYKNESIDLVLLDIWMPDEDGISLLKRWFENNLRSIVIMMSGHGSIETAVQSTKLGAYDFIEKPISIAKLLITIENGLKKSKLEKKNAELMQQLNPKVTITGKSQIIQNIKAQLEQLADKNLPVLFLGKAGTGKSFYARYLHQMSSRANEPFVVVNASSLSRQNQVEEIFGNKKKKGLIQIAEGGALFIDEVADLNEKTQSILTQVLRQGSYKQTGNEALIKPNVQLYFSTKKSQELLVNELLKEDFYYQIQIVSILIPTLQDYNDDIPELVNHFVYEFVDHEALPYRLFSMQALNFLRQYHWPGNVRELRNFIQRVLVMGGEQEVSLDEVSSLINIKPITNNNEAFMPIDLPIREAREAFEKSYFNKQLEYCEGNIAKLSDRAGMERTNLYRKLKSLGISYK